MRLAVIERVLLGNMLGEEQGNFATLRLIRVAREALSFTKEENDMLELVQQRDQVVWNPEAAEKLSDIDIDLDDVVDIIKRMLNVLNDQSRLTNQHFSLYEKFIEPVN